MSPEINFMSDFFLPRIKVRKTLFDFIRDFQSVLTCRPLGAESLPSQGRVGSHRNSHFIAVTQDPDIEE